MLSFQKERLVYRIGVRPVSFLAVCSQTSVHSDSWPGLRVPASSRSKTGGRFPHPARVPTVWPNCLASAVAFVAI